MGSLVCWVNLDNVVSVLFNVLCKTPVCITYVKQTQPIYLAFRFWSAFHNLTSSSCICLQLPSSPARLAMIGFEPEGNQAASDVNLKVHSSLIFLSNTYNKRKITLSWILAILFFYCSVCMFLKMHSESVALLISAPNMLWAFIRLPINPEFARTHFG